MTRAHWAASLRWRRVVRRLLQVIATLLALYLVGMNVFLRTRLFRDAVSFNPEAFRVEYSSAYSLFPGRFHVEGLAIRGKDSNVEWALAIDRCDFALAFTALLHRQFHAERVRGDGISFRVRLRVDRPSPEHDEALPPIAGFPDPPLTDVGPPPAPLSDADYDLWGVRLDDVDAEHVYEVWVDTIQLAGQMRVRGSWLFWPVRWLEVGPAIVDARDLTVSHAGRALATGVAGRVVPTIHPFDVRVSPGVEILRDVSLAGTIAGVVRMSEAVPAFVDVDGVDVRRGEGAFELTAAVDHGALRAGTHVDVELLDSAVDVGEVSIAGAVHGAFDVVATADGPVATAAVGGAKLVARKGAIVVDAASIDSTVTSRALDLSRGAFADATFAARWTDVSTPSIAAWQAPLPPTTSLALTSGAARASGHAEGSIRERAARGAVTFAIDGFAAHRNDERLACAVTGDVAFTDLSLERKTLVLGESRLDVRGIDASFRGAELHADHVSLNASRATVSADEHRVAVRAAVVSERIAVEAKGLAVHAALNAHVSLERFDWSEGTLDLSGSDVALSGLVTARSARGHPSSTSPP